VFFCPAVRPKKNLDPVITKITQVTSICFGIIKRFMHVIIFFFTVAAEVSEIMKTNENQCHNRDYDGIPGRPQLLSKATNNSEQKNIYKFIYKK
jgi:hypothetical protein